MLVCHCNAVSDRTVRKAVRAGAVTLDEIGRVCAAGTCCGGCTDSIAEVIRAENVQRASSPSGSAAPGTP